MDNTTSNFDSYFLIKELSNCSIRALKAKVLELHKAKKITVFSKQMINTLLGVDKCWTSLTKGQLILMFTAWKRLMSLHRRSSQYSEINMEGEVYLYRGNYLYKKYLPASTLSEAREKARGKFTWVAIRKGKRCYGAKWEVEVWHPKEEISLITEKERESIASTGSSKHANKLSVKSLANLGGFTENSQVKEKPKKEAMKKNLFEQDLFSASLGNISGKSLTKDWLLKQIREAKESTGWTAHSDIDRLQNYTSQICTVHFWSNDAIKTDWGETYLKEIKKFTAWYVPGKGWCEAPKTVAGWNRERTTYYSELTDLVQEAPAYCPF